MRCEVIAVGTELLLGQIIDTNSAWIGDRLALAGIDAHFQTRVGDNLERIERAIRIALDRSDAVITCGGLGPTHDDITREAIARVMGATLVRDAAIVKRIREQFAARGRTMSDNNLRQADVPAGARVITQMPGTAPGLVCPVGDKVIYAVPGIPYEMRDMVDGTIMPDLKDRAGISAIIKSRTLRTWGQSESGLAESLSGVVDELDQTGDATIAFLASGIEGLKVRITVKGPDEATVDQALAKQETRLRNMLGDLVFGTDAETMESVVIDLLRRRSLSLAAAESLTGGMLGTRITAVPGASDVFRGSIVAYASDVKFDVLGVPQGPVVSEQAAKAMAIGARRVLAADIGVSTTGVAGPAEQEGQPAGTVFVGLAIGDQVEARRLSLPGDREHVRQFSVIGLLNLLRLRLLGKL